MWHEHWQQESICPSWSWVSFPLPCSSLILKVTQDPSGIRKKCPPFLCFVWGDAHQVAFHHSLYWWPGFSVQELLIAKGAESPGTPVVPRFVSDLMCLFTPESVTSLLTCTSVRGAACVGRGWDRLCCWYSRLNFAASAVLLECSSLSIVWGNEGNSFLFGFTLL